MNLIGLLLLLGISAYYSYKSYEYLNLYSKYLKYGIFKTAIVVRKDPITFRNYVPVVKFTTNEANETRVRWFDLILVPLTIGSEVEVMLSPDDTSQLPMIKSPWHIFSIVFFLLVFYSGFIFFLLKNLHVY